MALPMASPWSSPSLSPWLSILLLPLALLSALPSFLPQPSPGPHHCLYHDPPLGPYLGPPLGSPLAFPVACTLIFTTALPDATQPQPSAVCRGGGLLCCHRFPLLREPGCLLSAPQSEHETPVWMLPVSSWLWPSWHPHSAEFSGFLPAYLPVQALCLLHPETPAGNCATREVPAWVLH